MAFSPIVCKSILLTNLSSTYLSEIFILSHMLFDYDFMNNFFKNLVSYYEIATKLLNKHKISLSLLLFVI